ncbi:restriction endonuclease subunit S [Arthrobacter sp. 179]|uniref:restriction endonuclease subunit S n=1 Tax=Arthrobacter sp. 179 TaxID=3457734 RepID=UPI004034E8E3
MPDWQTKTLGEVLNFQRGFDITRATQRAGNIPVVSSGGISSYHDTPSASGPGVVIGRKGTLGKAYYLPSDYWPHDTTLWVQDFKGSDPRFVYYFMSRFDVSWLDAGSANPTLNRNHLHPLSVSWPPVKEQQIIAEVLGALDDKIAANDRLANKLFELAALEHETSLDLVTAHVPLSSLATTVLGGTPSRAKPEYWSNGTVPWLNSGKANEDRIVEPSALITADALARSAAKLMPVATTLIAITGATLGKVARLEIEAAGNQSLVGAWSDRPDHNSWLHFAIRSEIPQLLRKATGAAQQHVNKQDVDSLLIPMPADEDVLRAGKSISVLLNSAHATDLESRLLRETRDALLPRLISGKLRTKEAAEAVTATI